MVGIYKIASPSGKVYIGQTWNIKERVIHYTHIDCKGQRKLYFSILKYGWINHIFEIIHELPKDVEQDVLDRYEQLYMDLHRDCGFKLLNLREAGSTGKMSIETRFLMSLQRIGNKSNKGRNLSENHKKNIGKSLKNRNFTDKHRKNLSISGSKAIIQMDLNRKKLKEWFSVTEAELSLEIYSGGISKCCNKKLKSVKGFIWEFKIIIKNGK